MTLPLDPDRFEIIQDVFVFESVFPSDLINSHINPDSLAAKRLRY